MQTRNIEQIIEATNRNKSKIEENFIWKCDYKVKVRKCKYCHEKYDHYTCEVEYKLRFRNKTYKFCSYNCKMKFIHEHEEELEKEWLKKYEY